MLTHKMLNNWIIYQHKTIQIYDLLTSEHYNYSGVWPFICQKQY